MENEKNIEKNLCIILLNYNNERDTLECVRSIYNSDNIELPYIVIVDNSDIKSIPANYLNFYPDLKILNPGHNLGFAEGNNYGIRWALSKIYFKYLFVLNNDTILLKDTLYQFIKNADNNPSVSVFTPCIITDEVQPRIWYSGGDLDYIRMTPRMYNIGKEFRSIHTKDSLTGFASGCSIFISSKGLNLNENLFDPCFFMYDEDVELSLRLIKRKMPIFYLSSAVVIHMCQGSQKPDSGRIINQLSPKNINLLFYLENTIKNRYYIVDKHFTGLARVRICFQLTVYWILKSLHYCINLKFRASFFVIAEVIKNRFICYLRKTEKKQDNRSF